MLPPIDNLSYPFYNNLNYMCDHIPPKNKSVDETVEITVDMDEIKMGMKMWHIKYNEFDTDKEIFDKLLASRKFIKYRDAYNILDNIIQENKLPD